MSTNRTAVELSEGTYNAFDNSDFKAYLENEDNENLTRVYHSDTVNQMDSVETLTSGPVMAALRNEKFNESRSLSSDSFR